MAEPIRPIRVAHVITALGMGGAESMLCKLVSAAQGTEITHRVYALHGGGHFSERIRAAGVPVEVLGGPNPFAIPLAIGRLALSLRGFRPDILQTWLFRGDLAGLVVRQLYPESALLWNLRCATRLGGRGGVLPSMLARFSACPDAVVVNSHRGREIHEQLGYRPKEWVVLPNGFDLERFRPDVDRGGRVRRELGIPEGATVLGAVGRWDPLKGFDTLLGALGELARRRRELQVLLVGSGFVPENPILTNWLQQLQPNVRVHCVGEREDPETWFNAMDVFVLPSRAEGFPNVLGEAMASGCCCVTTDVGDACHMLADAGWTVPPEAPEQLAEVLNRACDLTPQDRRAFGRAARQRVENEFSLSSVVERYEALYRRHARNNCGRRASSTARR